MVSHAISTLSCCQRLAVVVGGAKPTLEQGLGPSPSKGAEGKWLWICGKMTQGVGGKLAN